ncbi:SO2930 family diheme c-type cytochrome [Dyella sp.]|uniref:SO2930 family diheme c-type cytochrome n=1 Tax=Dyella sp. TaxID=1869338 RepID=UPI002ED56191
MMRFKAENLLAVLCMMLALSACHRGLDPVVFHADGRPAHLSDWHVLEVRDGKLMLNQGVVPYDLNTPLFTDYAHKLRTIWMPKGVAARYDASDTFDFPVGTIISKTFFYPRGSKPGDVTRTYDSSHDFAGQGLDLAHVRLVETRVLVRRSEGWVAIPYVWNDTQTDASLARTGAVIPLTLVASDQTHEDFNYVVPDESQCASCHAQDWVTRRIHPIGPKARHLNRDYRYAEGDENQLQYLMRVGYLTGAPAPAVAPRNANWMDTRAPLDARARAYLDINCGHCHNPEGAANTTALTLDISAPEDRHLGLCKPPVAAGRGTGDHLFDIVPGKPEDSIVPYRMASKDPGEMMPELGRSTVHQEGVALIKAWIATQSGACVAMH